MDSERRTRSVTGTVAGDPRRADRLRPSQHRDKRARVVRRLARQGLLQPITGAESRGPRPRRAPRRARRSVAARAHDVPSHLAQPARSILPLQRLWVPPCAKSLSRLSPYLQRLIRHKVLAREVLRRRLQILPVLPALRPLMLEWTCCRDARNCAPNTRCVMPNLVLKSKTSTP